jgi:hypothetical protein
MVPLRLEPDPSVSDPLVLVPVTRGSKEVTVAKQEEVAPCKDERVLRGEG